jgi:hypothetical protein
LNTAMKPGRSSNGTRMGLTSARMDVAHPASILFEGSDGGAGEISVYGARRDARRTSTA